MFAVVLWYNLDDKSYCKKMLYTLDIYYTNFEEYIFPTALDTNSLNKLRNAFVLSAWKIFVLQKKKKNYRNIIDRVLQYKIRDE